MLQFDDGQKLIFLDDSEAYECYKIRVGENLIVV
jgi:hypothetical protein